MQEIRETSSYRIALKDRILEIAISSFIENGIRAVKMDDIAQKLGISKRTLYEIYVDKEELLYQCIKKYDQNNKSVLAEYAAKGHNVIDIILEAYQIKVDQAQKVNPLFYEDIMKYPKVEQYIKDSHDNTHDKFMNFMQQGADDGFFRQDVNYDLIIHVLDAMGEYIMRNKLLRRYPVNELFSNFFLVSLRGLCTERGVKMLDAALTKIQ